MAVGSNSSGVCSRSRTKLLLWRGLSRCPPKGWERLQETPVGPGEPMGAQPHASFGSSVVPKMFGSSRMIRNCCGYSR